MNDINNIIENYFNGESTLSEENRLKSYVNSSDVSEEHLYLKAIFNHFESERQLGLDFEPDMSFLNESKGKVRFMMPKLIGIAASLVLLISVAFAWFNSTDTTYKNKYTQLENPAEADEALAITLDALGFLGQKLDKGTASITHMKNFEKTAVFNFNK